MSTAADEDDEYSDWIEIYNAGTSSIDLDDYTLSDNPELISKWKFPSKGIGAGEYVIVWCSGKDDDDGRLHTNFSLKSQGEIIFLSDPSGNSVDVFFVPFLPADKTYGRLTDGGGTLCYLSNPSFDYTNNSSALISGALMTSPVFNIPGGFYLTPQNIILSHPDPTNIIYYTLDGSDPTENSLVYTGPITLQSRAGEPNYYSTIRTGYPNHSYLPHWFPPLGEVYKCNIVRARIFKPGYFPGPIQTQTYFVDPEIFTRYGILPLVSIVSDPKNLFNDTTGIYVPGLTYQETQDHGNYHNDWKRPANIEMFNPDGQNAFNGNFQISIGGESSKSSPQKGLNVNASSDFGPDKIRYPIFKNTLGRAKYIQEFDKIKIRSWGTDRRKGLLHDGFCNSFMTKTDLDYAAYQPCVVFINGEYWGLQELRERNRKPDYYESHYYIDKDNPGVDIIKGGGNRVEEGDADHWDDMIAYINSHSIRNSSNYAYIKTQMDVDNFMLYCMFSLYLSRGDWPDQNEAKWRPRISGGKWKWIQWDMDNTVANNLPPWFDTFEQALIGNVNYGPSELLSELVQNTEFKNKFINLFADYMNTVFLQPYAQGRLDDMVGELMPYIQEFKNRWQLNPTWQDRLDSMEWWLEKRPKYVKEDIISNFGVGDVHELTLNVSDTVKGNIKVNTLFLDENTPRITHFTYPWTGEYFEDVPIPLTAIAKPGFRFIKWLPSNNSNSSILLDLNENESITALFDVDPNYQPKVLPVINEAMSSNSSTIADNYSEYDDWLEIYNPSNDTLDLAGYYLTDNLVMPTRFKFASGNDSTKIAPHGFLLVWIDDDLTQGVLHSPFKFNSTGDFIALIDPNRETIIDSIRFGVLGQDVSYGCTFDASDQYIYFNPATPGSANWTYITENILINELQTLNVSTVQDNYGEYDQWIELYNPNPVTIDIAGWKISTNQSSLSSFTFEHNNDSTKIVPYGFKLLWADNDLTQGALHLDFNLTQNGCVKLFKPSITFGDSICYSGLNTDASYGRTIDGDPNWINFSIPTPDSNNVNLNTGIHQMGQGTNLQLYPNPIYGNKIFFNQTISFNLYDVLGRKIAFVKEQSELDLSKLDKGIYFIAPINNKIFKIIKN